MRKFVMVVAGALAAAAAIATVALAAGTTPDTKRSISGSVSTGSGTPHSFRPASLNFTLLTTRLSMPNGALCVPFGGDCVLPNIAVHDDITLPSGFKYNGGIQKGNSSGRLVGSGKNPVFPICSGADTNPPNGVPDIVESSSGPGAACKTIGGGLNKGTAYTHTCGDSATPNSQTAIGRKLKADIAVYNGGGKANGDGGTLYGRLVVSTVQGGTVIASGAIKVSWTKNKLSFEVPDGLIKPFGACAPLTSTILNIVKKSGTTKRRVGGRVVSASRGLVESGSCPKSRKWTLSNTVRQSTGATDPSTGKVIRSLSDPAVTTVSGSTTVSCRV
jgi:hypothetical protein